MAKAKSSAFMKELNAKKEDKAASGRMTKEDKSADKSKAAKGGKKK